MEDLESWVRPVQSYRKTHPSGTFVVDNLCQYEKAALVTFLSERENWQEIEQFKKFVRKRWAMRLKVHKRRLMDCGAGPEPGSYHLLGPNLRVCHDWTSLVTPDGEVSECYYRILFFRDADKFPDLIFWKVMVILDGPAGRLILCVTDQDILFDRRQEKSSIGVASLDVTPPPPDYVDYAKGTASAYNPSAQFGRAVGGRLLKWEKRANLENEEKAEPSEPSGAMRTHGETFAKFVTSL